MSEHDESDEVAESSTEKPKGMPRDKRGRYAKHEAMAAFVVGERRREPTVAYSALITRTRERYGVGRATAERAITTAAEVIRQDFEKFCGDAPRAIFDGYMEIYTEAMRAKNLTAARRTLDSVRDMFGLKSAININMNLGNALPADAYSALTDEQLDALAVLDQSTTRKILDVPSVEASIGLAGVAIDAVDVDGDE